MSFLGDLFGGGGQQQAPSSVQTLSQTSEFPTEVKPFITDVLEKAKAQQEGREFELFEGPRIAPFSPEEQSAFSGVQGIQQAGLGAFPDLASSAFYAQQAQDAAEQGLKQFDATEAQRLINPFQQQVIDIEKDEAIRQFEGTTQPQIAAQAAGAGSFGGSRQAILEAEASRNLQQQLGDIQSRGLRDAYDTAARQFEAERARQTQGAGQFGQFAQDFPGQALRELGALQSVGEQRKAVDQRALDIALSDFLTEQEFPTRQLQEYQSLIRGFPISPNQFTREVSSVPAVPLSQQLLGAAGTGLGLAGAFGAFRKSGGQIEGGLSSLETHQNNEPYSDEIETMIRLRMNTHGQSREEAEKFVKMYVNTAKSFEFQPPDYPHGGELTDDPEATMEARKKQEIPFVPESRPKPVSNEELLERRAIVLAQPGSKGNFTGLLDRQAAEHKSITDNLMKAKDDYLLETDETKKLRELLKTRAGGLGDKYESDKKTAEENYTNSLWRALAAGGIELMSQRDPGAGGLLGQVGAAAKRSGAIESLADAAKTKTDKIEALEERKDDLELKYAEVSAQLANAPKEKKFAYEKTLAELRVKLADSRSDLASAIAEAGTVDVIGQAQPTLALLTEVKEESGFSGTKLHSEQQRKFTQAAERRRADYKEARGEGTGATHDRSEETLEMKRLMSDALQKIRDYAGSERQGNFVDTLKGLTSDDIYDLGTVDNLTVREVLSRKNKKGREEEVAAAKVSVVTTPESEKVVTPEGVGDDLNELKTYVR